MEAFLNKAMERSCALEKGIAHYMCRELIEEIRSEYNIPNSVIAEINKKSVDGAMAVVKALEVDIEHFTPCAFGARMDVSKKINSN